MKRLIVAAVLTVLVTGVCSAQWQFGFGLGTIVDNNAFNTSQQIPDRITALSFSAGHAWETEKSLTTLSYEGAFNYFALLPARTNHVHEFGVQYEHMIDEEREFLFETGGAYSIRSNRPDFRIFDFSQLTLSAQTRGHVSDGVLLKGGYAFRSLRLAQADDFNYAEHLLFASAALSVASRTTAIVESDFGLKKYLTPNPTPLSMQTGGRSSGKMGGLTVPQVSQLMGLLRIGQGLSEATGLSLTGQYLWSLQKESRYLIMDEGVLTDDELFDDHYGYEGGSLMMMLTQTFPAGAKAQCSASIQDRRYGSRPAFDLAGTQIAAQRRDSRMVFTLALEKEFATLFLHVRTEASHIVNLSNDALYDYRNSLVSIHLAFEY
jgi:hypothetical protein